ncbi:MAG TPA: ABC transporter ATP-binding protein [Polyangia bacterium]
MIELRQVAKSYHSPRGETIALADIDLTVERGELLCLVGPSGCGKTTLLNLIAGLERPDAGEVLVDGRPITGPGPDRGVIFQEAALFPWLTVIENVEFGLREQKMPRAERHERAAEHLATVGMSQVAKAYVHELSGGMRQRVALARALALEPAILLMDEPFGALDARTRDTLQSELIALWESTHKTIVFVTHDIAEAVRLGSRIVLLAAGPARVSLSLALEPILARPRHVDQPKVLALAARLKQYLDHPEDRGEPPSADAGQGEAPGARGARGAAPGLGLPG